MSPHLLNDDTLKWSDVVANCRMNRERELAGTNSYTADLRCHPLDIVQESLARHREAAWLDLCCGTGRALIQAARQLHELGLGDRVQLRGIDLVGLFDPIPADMSCLTLEQVSVRDWSANRDYDLITCVHGLHYVGDKLGLIARAVSWLTADGLFLAHLDLGNLKRTDGRQFAGALGKQFKRLGLIYDRRHHLLSCRGKRLIAFPFTYAGADDTAGPNVTRQPAVDSYYDAVT